MIGLNDRYGIRFSIYFKVQVDFQTPDSNMTYYQISLTVIIYLNPVFMGTDK